MNNTDERVWNLRIEISGIEKQLNRAKNKKQIDRLNEAKLKAWGELKEIYEIGVQYEKI